MFVWTSGFQKSLAQTEFNMFLDEWTSANESPGLLSLKSPVSMEFSKKRQSVNELAQIIPHFEDSLCNLD